MNAEASTGKSTYVTSVVVQVHLGTVYLIDVVELGPVDINLRFGRITVAKRAIGDSRGVWHVALREVKFGPLKVIQVLA